MSEKEVNNSDKDKKKQKSNNDIPVDFVTVRNAGEEEKAHSSSVWTCQTCGATFSDYGMYKRHFSSSH